MKDENYINIQGWQITRLELKGNELILYALIYGFSQDGHSKFRGSLSYIEKALGISRNTIIGILDKLTEKNYIKKEFNPTGNLYSANTELVQKLHRGGAKNALVSSAETAHNNNKDINNNTYIYTLFEKFWDSYPNKTNKRKSLQLWVSKKLDGKIEEILEFIKRAKNTDRWQKGFVKAPDVFIRNESWNDDLSAYGKSNVYKNKGSNLAERLTKKIYEQKI